VLRFHHVMLGEARPDEMRYKPRKSPHSVYRNSGLFSPIRSSSTCEYCSLISSSENFAFLLLSVQSVNSSVSAQTIPTQMMAKETL
jgi:hypothetical protein